MCHVARDITARGAGDKTVGRHYISVTKPYYQIIQGSVARCSVVYDSGVSCNPPFLVSILHMKFIEYLTHVNSFRFPKHLRTETSTHLICVFVRVQG